MQEIATKFPQTLRVVFSTMQDNREDIKASCVRGHFCLRYDLLIQVY